MDENDALKYFSRENYKKALEIFLDMLEEAEDMKDKERISYNANFAGLCLYFLHMPYKSLDYFDIALENTEGEENEKVQKNIDEVNKFIKRINEDIEKVEAWLEKEDDEKNKGILVSNLGILKYLIGKNDESEELFKRAEKIFLRMNDKIALGATYSNFAMLYDDIRKLDYLYKALDIFVKEGHIKGQVDTLHSLSLFYLNENNLEEGYFFIKKELELIDKIEDRNLRRREYEFAADIAMELGKIDDGMKFTEKASEV